MTNKRAIAGASLLLGFAAGIALPAAAALTPLRAQGTFRVFLSKLEWAPGSGCYRPQKPISGDEYARSRFISDAEQYLSCLETAATEDAKYAAGAVAKGYQQEVDDFLAEVKR